METPTHTSRPLPLPTCSLSLLNEAARRYRKEHFQRANADPTDTEASEAYYYEEGRTRAYSEGLNALTDQKAIARQRIEALKDHCREVNPTWAWLMREVLEIVDPQKTPLPDHLCEDAICLQCSKCGRKSWGGDVAHATCGMPAPTGGACDGVFLPENVLGEPAADSRKP